MSQGLRLRGFQAAHRPGGAILTADTADITASFKAQFSQIRTIKAALELVLDVAEVRNVGVRTTLEDQLVDQASLVTVKQQS